LPPFVDCPVKNAEASILNKYDVTSVSKSDSRLVPLKDVSRKTDFVSEVSFVVESFTNTSKMKSP
jgi:hypothetical protein